MRTDLPHVLRDHAVPRKQASINLAPRGLGDSGGVSLSAATSLAYGSPIWWSPRRLSRHRRFVRSPVAFSIFHRNEQLGTGASNRRCLRVSLLGNVSAWSNRRVCYNTQRGACVIAGLALLPLANWFYLGPK